MLVLSLFIDQKKTNKKIINTKKVKIIFFPSYAIYDGKNIDQNHRVIGKTSNCSKGVSNIYYLCLLRELNPRFRIERATSYHYTKETGAEMKGFEPLLIILKTTALPLSYTSVILNIIIKSRMKGFEPLLLALEANVFPLNYIP